MRSRRLLVLGAGLLGCLWAWARYAQLERLYEKLPAVLAKLSALGVFADRLGDCRRFEIRRFTDSWMDACARRSRRDTGVRNAAQPYRASLRRMADFIDEQEKAGIYAVVLEPGDEPLLRIRALRAWLGTEAGGPDEWNCDDAETPERLAQLGQVLDGLESCVRWLSQRDLRDVVWRRRMTTAACGAPLRVALPGTEPRPALAHRDEDVRYPTHLPVDPGVLTAAER